MGLDGPDWTRRKGPPNTVGKLHFVRLVIKPLCTLKVDGIFPRDALDHLGRIKEPPAVVFPIVNIICKIVIHAGANGVDIEHVRWPSPAGATLSVLRHITHGNHLAPVYRPEQRQPLVPIGLFAKFGSLAVLAT